MNEKRPPADRLGAVEGADAAALGVDAPVESAPRAAEVDDEQTTVPGARMDEAPRDEPKPWFTNLAAASDQAGVANEPPEEQEAQFPEEDEFRR